MAPTPSSAIDYSYRLANAYVLQVASRVKSIPQSIWDLAPINLYYAVATVSSVVEDQDWW